MRRLDLLSIGWDQLLRHRFSFGFWSQGMSAQFGVDYLRPFVEVDHGCRPGDSMADLVFSSALSDVRTSFPVTFCCLHLAEGAVALDHPLGLVCHPGPTCVDDDAIYLQHNGAATLSANLLATTEIVLAHAERHGLKLDVKQSKSEAVVSLRGQVCSCFTAEFGCGW